MSSSLFPLCRFSSRSLRGSLCISLSNVGGELRRYVRMPYKGACVASQLVCDVISDATQRYIKLQRKDQLRLALLMPRNLLRGYLRVFPDSRMPIAIPLQITLLPHTTNTHRTSMTISEKYRKGPKMPVQISTYRPWKGISALRRTAQVLTERLGCAIVNLGTRAQSQEWAYKRNRRCVCSLLHNKARCGKGKSRAGEGIPDLLAVKVSTKEQLS